MRREFPGLEFERYADDVVCHCKTREQAEALRVALEARLVECGLELSAGKTKVVYCKHSNRKEEHPETQFTFLGYDCRPRRSKSRSGRLFVSFGPGVSDKAGKAIRQTVRRWELQSCVNSTLEEVARRRNATIRGWMTYYGAYHRSALYRSLRQIDRKLAVWATRRYKRLRRKRRKAMEWLMRVARRQGDLFAHWRMLYGWAR